MLDRSLEPQVMPISCGLAPALGASLRQVEPLQQIFRYSGPAACRVDEVVLRLDGRRLPDLSMEGILERYSLGLSK